MNKTRLLLMAGLLVIALAAGWYFWSRMDVPRSDEAQAVSSPVAVAPTQPILPSAPPSAAPATEPAIQHPVEVLIETTDKPAEPAGLPSLMDSDSFVADAVTRLLGRKDVLTFLQLDGFVQRVVATVDNLGRHHAPRNKWPVNPTPDRFTTIVAESKDGKTGVEYISPANSNRYVPLVRFLELVDTARAVRLYAALYPLFQQAYEELGYPRKYFNDRLVEVVDLLLATPVQQGPVAVTLVEVKGEVPSLTPWVRYEFVAPELKALTAGQKMLVRTGPDNHRRLQAKLRELRAHLVPVRSGVERPASGERKP